MKIVLPNLPFPYIQGLASALKTLEESCDMQILLWNLEKPLMDVLDELRPDIILLYQQHIDVTLDSDTAVCDFDNSSWTSATFTARGLLLYNTTVITGFTSNRSIVAINFVGDKTVTSGTFTIEFPAAGASTAIIQLT